MNKLIILDRDGVINHDSPNYIKTPKEWMAIDGSLEAIRTFKQAGFTVVIATNQSGIARGLYDEKTLHQIHNKMAEQLGALATNIDAIFYCPHGPDDQCSCRKPKPGLLEQAMHKYHVKPQDTYFIGDSLRDVQAAEAAQCHPVLVETGNGVKTLNADPTLESRIQIFKDLLQTSQDFV